MLCAFTGSNAHSFCQAKKPLGKCNHGPNGACANCRPFVAEDEAKPSYRCRNHGPHGSCIECIEREDRLKMRLKLQVRIKSS